MQRHGRERAREEGMRRVIREEAGRSDGSGREGGERGGEEVEERRQKKMRRAESRRRRR